MSPAGSPPAEGAVRPARCAGLLLTGGRSRRMGRDKASLVIEGVCLAERLGRLLAEVAAPALEVGPGRSGLEAVREEPPYAGPLAAVVAGWRVVRSRGHTGPVLVLASDLPLLDGPLLELLAHRPGTASAIPVVEGRRQLLCARYGSGDLERAEAAFVSGERALRAVPFGDDLEELSEAIWGEVTSVRALTDLDTPDDLARLGLSLAPGADAEGPAPRGGSR